MPHSLGPSRRVSEIPASAIHAMTALSKTVEDVAFLSWAKPTTTAPKHIHEGAWAAIAAGRADGYSETAGLQELREEIVKKLRRDNGIEANRDQIIVTVGAIEGLSAALMARDQAVLSGSAFCNRPRRVSLRRASPDRPCDRQLWVSGDLRSLGPPRWREHT